MVISPEYSVFMAVAVVFGLAGFGLGLLAGLVVWSFGSYPKDLTGGRGLVLALSAGAVLLLTLMIAVFQIWILFSYHAGGRHVFY